MPQNLGSLSTRNNSGGSLYVTESGLKTALNVTTATQVKSSAGRVAKVYINTAPASGVGGVYDQISTTPTAANLIQSWGTAAVVGPLTIDCGCANGIMVTPGASGVVSVSYS